MNWWQRLLRSKRMERELEAELRFHFETQVAEKMRSGLSEDEARREARMDFGAMEQPYPPNVDMSAETRFVSEGYFNAMGMKLLRGRLLSPDLDKAANPAGTMVVNEAFQKKSFRRSGGRASRRRPQAGIEERHRRRRDECPPGVA